jgi:hypothetical protein
MGFPCNMSVYRRAIPLKIRIDLARTHYDVKLIYDS